MVCSLYTTYLMYGKHVLTPCLCEVIWTDLLHFGLLLGVQSLIIQPSMFIIRHYTSKQKKINEILKDEMCFYMYVSLLHMKN